MQAIVKKQRESENLLAMEWSTKHSAIVAVSLIFNIIGASNSFITEPTTILSNVEQCVKTSVIPMDKDSSVCESKGQAVSQNLECHREDGKQLFSDWIHLRENSIKGK